MNRSLTSAYVFIGHYNDDDSLGRENQFIKTHEHSRAISHKSKIRIILFSFLIA